MIEGATLEEQIRLIYREYHRDVYQFLLYFTGDRNDAEDLTQDVFMRLLKNLPTFEGRSQLKTFLFSIAKHVAIDRYRKKKVVSFLSADWLRKIPAESGSPEREMESKANEELLDHALQKLKPQYRTVVILRGLKGLSIKETAEIIGCSEAKVKVDYHRALKQMQEWLSAEVEGGWTREYAK